MLAMGSRVLAEEQPLPAVLEALNKIVIVWTIDNIIISRYSSTIFHPQVQHMILVYIG